MDKPDINYDKPPSDAEDNYEFLRNSSKKSENSLANEIADNPLDAVIIAQLGQIEGRLNSRFAAMITRFEGLETRIEDRCGELHDRILSLPLGDRGEHTRTLMQSIQLLQLDSRRVSAGLAELRRAPPPAPAPDVAALVSAAVAEANQGLNKQIVALYDQLQAVAKKQEPPEPRTQLSRPRQTVVDEPPVGRSGRG